MNPAKARSTINAVAALARVTHTDAGNERSKLGRVSQMQLQAIRAGREASKRLQELKADMDAQVAQAEALVIDALQNGARVTNGLITPSVEQKTKFARISWKGAAEKFAKALGLDFTVVNAELTAEVEPKNVVVDVLKLSA